MSAPGRGGVLGACHALDGPGWGEYDDESRETWVIGESPVAGRYPEETSAALWADHQLIPLPLMGGGHLGDASRGGGRVGL